MQEGHERGMRDSVALAFLVHLLTAAGAGLALLAALAIVAGDWRGAFVWLGIAALLDGVDGPLARRLRIAERLPRWDGAALDNVVDYTTYVFLPALILALGCGLSGASAILAGGVVSVTGALYLADTRMKQPDNSFRGFPAAWNMAVFVLFAFQPPPALTVAVILALAALTFAPVAFVHPLRVVRWRPVTLAICAAWLLAALWLVAVDFAAAPLARAVLLAASAYLFAVSAIQRYWRAH
ncbi:MAG TPA: CDP-alcohol phosphatidyltransferase family protein [Afifellaceae bacterium]|nr:CDP-alcohol phosphatidyltransferase family protein [Afifellaceae bacterium]